MHCTSAFYGNDQIGVGEISNRPLFEEIARVNKAKHYAQIKFTRVGAANGRPSYEENIVENKNFNRAMPTMDGRAMHAPTKDENNKLNNVSDCQRQPLQNAGITLIALIITIIILLILAGVTIQFTLGENGILRNAKIAGEKYKNAVEYENELLGELYNESNNIINGIGSNNPTLVSKIKIGDYVAYDPTKGVTDKRKLEYESLKGSGLSHGNGYNLQKFTANSNIKWKVFNINKSTGEIVLISDNPILTDAGQDFYVRGATGYLYVEQELNEICKIYGYGKGANTTKQTAYEIGDVVDGVETKYITGSGARSINAEDINKITGYTPTQGNSAIINMYYPTMKNEAGISTATKNRNSINTCYKYTGSDYINKTDEMYKILFGNETNLINYHIANRSVWINDEGINGANFFNQCVYNGEVTAILNLAIWKGSTNPIAEQEFSKGIRPIVYLKANIKTSGQNEKGEWVI